MPESSGHSSKASRIQRAHELFNLLVESGNEAVVSIPVYQLQAVAIVIAASEGFDQTQNAHEKLSESLTPRRGGW